MSQPELLQHASLGKPTPTLDLSSPEAHSRGDRDLLIRLLAGATDLTLHEDPALWLRIKQAARVNGVSALLASVARGQSKGPQRTWCDLQLARNWDRYLRNLGDLEFALALLSAAGIDAIPLKGAFLAWREYDPPFTRKASLDIDLAIRSNDLSRACAALSDAGYSLRSSIEAASRQSHHVGLQHSSRTAIELHFRLTHGPLGIPVEEVFQRAVSGILPGGQSCLCLEPADELLQLALHVASHRFGSLFHLYELHLLWGRASVASRRTAIDRAVSHGFAGALALLDISFRLHWNEPFLPADLRLPRTWLHWRVDEALYRALEAWEKPGDTPRRGISGRLLDLQTTDTFPRAMSLIRVVIFIACSRLREGFWGTTSKRKSIGAQAS